MRLVMLGSLELVSGSPGHQRILHEPARLAVLILLGSCKSGFASRDRLTSLLWPDAPPARARNALRQALHRIRWVLGSDVITTWGNGDVGLNHEVICSDVQAFQRAAAQAKPLEATALYHGPFLPDYPAGQRREFADWIVGKREQLRRSAHGCLEELAARAESEGDLRTARMWWREALHVAPYDEVTLRSLMSCLSDQGAPAQALMVYRHTSRRMKEEFELEPDPSTRSLARRIRQQRTARDRKSNGPE